MSRWRGGTDDSLRLAADGLRFTGSGCGIRVKRKRLPSPILPDVFFMGITSETGQEIFHEYTLMAEQHEPLAHQRWLLS